MSIQSAGGTFGNYFLERLLGRGGMGEVWLAHDRDGRAVALKVLSSAYTADPLYRQRFEREARLGARARNPHIVPIHAFGEVDGHLFLEMAYIDGIDLGTRLRSGALPPDRAVDVIAQAAEALDAAHAAGLVHRDVKPGNILLHTSGFVYLIDFGIARAADGTALTATGLVVGTLGYMAPERFTGTVDARSDVYSLACVLYEALTGQPPYGAGDPAQQMRAHLMTEPPRASRAADGVPAALDDVIARGMAKEPDARYGSAGQFAAAASAALNPSARPNTPVPGSMPPSGRTPTRIMPVVTSTQPPPEVRPPAPTGQRGPRRKLRIATAAAAAALAAAAAVWLVAGGIDNGSAPVASTTDREAMATNSSTGAQSANPGPATRDGNFAFTVTDAATGSGSRTIVTLTVTNVSDHEQTWSIPEQRLVTTGGRSLPPDAAGTAELNPPGDFARIAPGRAGTFRLAFDLPGKNKNGKKNDKKDEAPSHLVLHGDPSSPGVTVPIR
ncbi:MULTISPECIES: serine/threonine-protein kinase [Nocardia]|uniref:non-specific serine/threonine protein kinase n=1 Tax=Nocardia implantans TaxID=3108168 RepID=A0ABU6AM61_9NOCA|nr:MULTISPECIES: serine/threonine-protein kinase [unclassified Nocardia]MBF6193379.1 protein kinase [Nocardia beijingensis]MEA3531482.1 serine/threonine-protein kinase [Nocardia sp. CDC192]MEB3508480.1 serine/threonine-protein kinase [Nocardia sp. CDC186]